MFNRDSEINSSKIESPVGSQEYFKFVFLGIKGNVDKIKIILIKDIAESAGFEPAWHLRTNTLSKRAPSATRTTLCNL